MPTDPTAAWGDESRNSRLDEAVLAYLQDIDSGRRPDRANLLARYPDLTTDLEKFFADQDGSLITTLRGADSGLVRRVAPPHGSVVGDLELLDTIGEGGMGVILRGHDRMLRRELAVKVLHESLTGRPLLEQRFIEEARIGGQLQHPGIVPVYALGKLPDARPYFTMKLVKGRTLAELLAERPDPARELPRFLGIFLQIAQTVAYAHSKAVLHRDLKPSNVMVGAFGEVQVMDWGLAKVLADSANAERNPFADDTAPRNAGEIERGPDTVLESQAGSVVGTYAYMAPEQARGEADALDPRADVFGLGAILCEILTGHPPYAGPTREETQRLARAADLTGALTRLDTSGADAELIGVARRCLAKDPGERPADGGAVAAAAGGYLSGVQERLRSAELARAKAETMAVEERKRRRVLAVLAAAVLLLVTGGGGGAWFWSRQLDQTEQRANLALNEAFILREQGKLREAAEAANQAVAVVEAGPVSASFKQSVLDQAQELTDKAEAVERRHRFLNLLAEVRSAKEGEFLVSLGDESKPSFSGGQHDINGEYAKTFKAYGADVDAVAAKEAVELFRDWAEDERVQLAAALDDWALERIRWSRPAKEWQRLVALARLVDPDPLRFELRGMFGPVVEEDQLERLRSLARPSFVVTLRPATVSLVARELWQSGAKDEAQQALRAGQVRHPNDVWLNYQLGNMASAQHRHEDAVRYFSAARALRPEIGHHLGHALQDTGRLEEAAAVFEEMIRLYPDNPNHHSCYGQLLFEQKKPEKAEAQFRLAIAKQYEFFAAHLRLGHFLDDQARYDEAESELREAVKIRTAFFTGHYNLGVFLRDRGRASEAEAEFRESIQLRTTDGPSHVNLGLLLNQRGEHAEAEAEWREAIRFEPELAAAHINLGALLAQQGKTTEAETEDRLAVKLAPKSAAAHNNLGMVLAKQAKPAEAEAEYHLALEYDPDYAPAHYCLGQLRLAEGKRAEAETLFRKAIQLQSDYAPVHCNLGTLLLGQGKRAEAEAEFRLAIKYQPTYALAHSSLGALLFENGERKEGEEEVRRAIELDPDYGPAHFNLGLILAHKDEPAKAEEEFRLAIKHQPDNAPAHTTLGALHLQRGEQKKAEEGFRAAIRYDSKYAPAHFNLAILLDEQGKRDEAAREFRQVIKLQPRDAEAHYNLGNLLMKDPGKRSDAEAAFRAAIDIQPNYAEAHCNLASVLRDQGKLTESLAEYRRGHEIGSDNPHWPYPSAQWVQQAQRLVELDKKLPDILRGDAQPKDLAERIDLARLCQYSKHCYAAATRLYADALAAEPKLAEEVGRPFRYDAACCAALAADGQGEDASNLDDKDQTRLRKQARDWLRADLERWTKAKDGGKADEVKVLRETLRHWQGDPDLASVRDAKLLEKLPEAERDAWKALWAEAEALLKQSDPR